MDPVNPWLDPSEVRHLAEQLLRPVAPARLAAADPGFDSRFVGFINTNQSSVETQPVAPQYQPQPLVPAKIIPQGIVIPPEPVPEIPTPPPTVPSQSRFLERIRIFRDWLEKNFQASDIFILDREGKVIFDESGHGRLHFMARNLALASRNEAAGNGNIHVKIGPASILEVIPCETPYGRIVLGAIVPEALPAAHVRTVTEVLIQTASPA